MNDNKHPYLWWIPNFITSLNLTFGSFAVFLGIQGYIGYAAICIGLAAVFDFLDGMSARLLHSYSELGKQLDSLCDLVSFGLAPATIAFSLLQLSLFGDLYTFSEIQATWYEWLLLASCLFIPIAGAFRLAKFNIDTRQETGFLGLPIPANALFFASLAGIVAWSNSAIAIDIVLNKFNLLISIIIFSSMMVSEVPMFSLKIKNFSWKDNQIRYIFLVLCLILMLLLGIVGLPLIIISYIVLSIITRNN
ncbi:MAG: CDP-alcohol phosphatidyltransferase family protein [Mangrovibacterium sp.]